MEASAKSAQLLNLLSQKKMTLDEFLKECAYWAIREGWDEIRVLPYPTPPDTRAFQEYENLTPLEQQRIDPLFFQKNPEILEYFYQRHMIWARNKANLDWLKEIYNYIPEEDFINRKKIEDKIFEFECWLNEEGGEIRKMKEIFDAKEI